MKKTIKVKTWQDVFIRFLKYLKDHPEYDFDFILDNQSKLFNGRKHKIIKWSSLQSYDQRIDLTRYRYI